MGKNFPPTDFKPELAPKEMLGFGVFGGKHMPDCRSEFPDNWFKSTKLSVFWIAGQGKYRLCSTGPMIRENTREGL